MEKLKILITSLILTYILLTFILLVEIDKRNNVERSMQQYINDSYYLEIDNYIEKKVKLVQENKFIGKRGMKICEKVKEIAINDNYYVGYLEKGNEEICGRYFYLNRYVDSDYKFGLAEREIYYKFGNIKYEKPEEYLKKYGEGGDLQGYVRYFSSVYGVIGLLIFIGGFIALNVLNYLIKKP